jgi:hypothetical protein
MDLVVINWRNLGGATVFLGHGDGNFGTERTFPSGHYSFSIATGDFNSDNRVDLA